MLRACGDRLRALLRPPTLAHARAYSCQKLSEQPTFTARVIDPIHREDARRIFWKSGWLPATLHGTPKEKIVHLTLPAKEYMQIARKPHIQRKLTRIDFEDEDGKPTGESVQALTNQVFEKRPEHGFGKWDEAADYDFITLRRWPETPPLLMMIPIMITNELKCPLIKSGYYAHEMFIRAGLPCQVSDPENIPMYLEGDMGKAVKGDLRIGDVEIPPGVVPCPHPSAFKGQGPNLPGRDYPNFLVCRSIRVRN